MEERTANRGARRSGITMACRLLPGLLGIPFAHAQNSGFSAAGQNFEAVSELDEVVVTATKRADSINRIPLTVTALTGSALLEQDIRDPLDLSRAVPGLFVTTPNTPNGATISIRGVSSQFGAPTTAVYLDDVPVQKRIVAGDATGSGSPFPELYDLDRVEVLKGPQGTLYGESAEGGAVRFITPAPSVTQYSGTARVELSGTEDGGFNHETGVAIGGPIVSDVLGFRLSLWDRHDSGYIDHVYAYTGQTLGSGTNAEDRWLGRLSLLWQVTDELSITPTIYTSHDHFGDSDQYTENVPLISAPAGANLAAHNYGPYAYGPYKTILNCNIGQDYVQAIPPCYEPQWRTSGLNVASLSIDYQAARVAIHSATGYTWDDTKGLADAGEGDVLSFQSGIPFLYNFPEYHGNLFYSDSRDNFTEELRFTSVGPPSAISWVGGLFASIQNTHQYSQDYADLDGVIQDLFGLTTAQILGAPSAADGGISLRDQSVRETEYAAFGEGTYAFDRFKTTVGLRVARDEIRYDGYLQGAFFGDAVATEANGGLSGGSLSNTAVLPKLSAQYQLSENQMVYATAAKGERVGGVNSGPYVSKCAATLAALGLSGTPETYNPDSLWSYELGAKLRTWGGRAQVNLSAFYIDWSHVQVTYTLPGPCYFSYVSNAGGAVSKGGEVQAQLELASGLRATVNAAYTDAYYSSTVTVGNPVASTFINKGDTLPVPPVSVDAGLRYDLPWFTQYKGYVRGDYQYSSPYKTGFGLGTSNYNPSTYVAGETRYAKLRMGMTLHDLEVSLFVDNVMNSQDPLSRTGGGACTDKTCTSYTFGVYTPVFFDTTFRPRTAGLTLNYKF